MVHISIWELEIKHAKNGYFFFIKFTVCLFVIGGRGGGHINYLRLCVHMSVRPYVRKLVSATHS